LFLTIVQQSMVRRLPWANSNSQNGVFLQLFSAMASQQPLLDDVERTEDRKEADEFDDVTMEELEAAEWRRQLLTSIALVIIYWLVGFAYGHLHADWSVADSIYFVVVTMTTVGYGDFSFTGQGWATKIFGGIYVFVGVAFIGAAAGVILDAITEKAEAAKAKLMKEAKQEIMDNAGAEYVFLVDKEIEKLHRRTARYALYILINLAVGSASMMYLEGWEFPDAFYFCCVTMTTVGYGDLEAKSSASKTFVIFFILVSFGILAAAISSVGGLPMEKRRLRNISKVLHQFGASIDLEEIKAMCSSEEIQQLRTAKMVALGPGKPYVDRSEFVIWQLIKQGKLDLSMDVLPVLHTFDKLDSDLSGRLNQEDIVAC